MAEVGLEARMAEVGSYGSTSHLPTNFPLSPLPLLFPSLACGGERRYELEQKRGGPETVRVCVSAAAISLVSRPASRSSTDLAFRPPKCQ